jgi:hypothetical protein
MSRILNTVLALDRWIDSIRVDWPTPGYGGPVVHWWSHQLVYRGTGLDWRYEGIIAGYIDLWRFDGDEQWLEKARRAGEDVLAGQLPDGHFLNSRFELNPGTGGTPHEAAVDIALFRLSQAFSSIDPPFSQRCHNAAVINLRRAYYERLWDPASETLMDSPTGETFVPNKAATFLEAVLLHAETTGNPRLIERYAVPAARRILEMQVNDPDSFLDGAIAQNRFGSRVVLAYFPLYIARCIPPLFRLSATTGDDRVHRAALSAAQFLARCRFTDGSYPQVLYPKRRRVDMPRWIAGAGDILRALEAANQYGTTISTAPTLEWILSGARDDGRIATARGFDRVLPVFTRQDRALDEIGVAGWIDKAFRVLASQLAASSARSFVASDEWVREPTRTYR